MLKLNDLSKSDLKLLGMLAKFEVLDESKLKNMIATAKVGGSDTYYIELLNDYELLKAKDKKLKTYSVYLGNIDRVIAQHKAKKRANFEKTVPFPIACILTGVFVLFGASKVAELLHIHPGVTAFIVIGGALMLAWTIHVAMKHKDWM